MSKQKDDLNRLVEQSIKGDEKAFSKLCQLKGESIVYRCVQLMGNFADGQDASQEVFIRLYKNIHALKSPEAFGVWLHRLITNTCYSLRKKLSKPGSDLPLDEVSDSMPETKTEMIPQEYLADDQKRQMLLEVINDLPAGMRDCVVLYYYEDMPVKDIARVLESNEAAVNMQLYRARLKIRAELEKSDSGAYAHALLPFAAISIVLQGEAAAIAPASVISGCMKAAGIKTVRFGANTTSSAVLKPAALALAGVTVVAATIFVASSLASQPAEPQQPAVTTGVEDTGAISSAQPYSPSPGLSAASPEGSVNTDSSSLESVTGSSTGAGTGASSNAGAVASTGHFEIIGKIYLDNPNSLQKTTWYSVYGATVQLYSADGSTPLGSAIAADGESGFVLPVEASGQYRVLITLPSGARFIQDTSLNAAPLAADSNRAWLTWQGQEVLSLQAGTPYLTGLNVAAYYPASISGRVTVSGEGSAAGLAVDLTRPDGSIIAVATTNSDGSYFFDNPQIVQQGDYVVKVRLPLPVGAESADTVAINIAPGQSMTLPDINLVMAQG